MTQLYHILDPVGDLVLILSTTSHVADKMSLSDVQARNVEIAGSSPSGSKRKASNSQEIQVRVSSKHLTLASRVFDSMLKPGFSEGDKLRSQGHAALRLPEDNPAALLILLNLMHGRFKAVPRKVDLSMLTELATLVDKYELLEITEMFQGSWMEVLEKSITEEFNDDLLPWICISYVFKKAEIFQRVTRIAQMRSKGPIEEYRLPIPESVLGKQPSYTFDDKRLNNWTVEIDTSRQQTLARMFAYVKLVLDKYQGHERTCETGLKCTAMVLGFLTISLTAIGILPLPDAPYKDFCFETLAQRLREMEILQYCELHPHPYIAKCEGVKKALLPIISRREQELHGLRLDAFQRKEQTARPNQQKNPFGLRLQA
ncbi:hypothetical protein MMC17_006435 [Xylographa soralifera]|nr:hypothetical protein [Xylographa soralifera]